jgi:sterol desaturase/sphingolipid hydroxylase (fatty acid hydroxylase superfamily)
MAKVANPRRTYQPEERTERARTDGEWVKFGRGMRLYFAGPAAYIATLAFSGSLPLAFLVGMIVMFVNHAQLEKRHPYLSGLEKTVPEYIKDFIDKAKLALVLTLLGVFLAFYFFSWLRQQLGVSWTLMGAFSAEPPDGSWSQIMLWGIPVMIVGDFFVYWYHRTAHSLGESVLWRMHTVHHSIPHFTAAYGARAYPLETFNTYFWYGAAGGALGIPVESTFAGASLVMFFMSAHHINADATIGPLRWILVTTEMHRWHHNVDYLHAKNYSLLLTIWDRAFGTYNVPHPFVGSMGVNHFPKEFPDSGMGQTKLILQGHYEDLKARNL